MSYSYAIQIEIYVCFFTENMLTLVGEKYAWICEENKLIFCCKKFSISEIIALCKSWNVIPSA